MTKERTPTSYLEDKWLTDEEGDSRKNASGADSDGGDYEYGNPYRAPMPETPEWGIGAKDATSYGHSDEVADTGTKSSAWGMSKDDQAKGYSRGEADGEGSVLGTRQPDGSFPQSVPSTNEHDRSDRSREFRTLEEGHHSGHDGARSSPGRQLIGSRENLG
jgi:hypothetical protein